MIGRIYSIAKPPTIILEGVLRKQRILATLPCKKRTKLVNLYPHGKLIAKAIKFWISVFLLKKSNGNKIAQDLQRKKGKIYLARK